MTRETFVAVLESEGFKAGAKGFAIPEERELTVFVSAPGDVVQIARVVRVELKDAFAGFETAKAERFFFSYQDLLGVKLGHLAPSKDRSAGFGR